MVISGFDHQRTSTHLANLEEIPIKLRTANNEKHSQNTSEIFNTTGNGVENIDIQC